MLRRVLIALAVAATVACGDPPEKEMQQAQGAIDAAKAVGADRYATEEFTAAQDALKRANEAVVQRDYRQALNDALDARERAQTAAKQAADHKAKARVDADRALTTAAAALDEAHVRLKAAEAAHAPARTLATSRRTVASVEQAVQKARTAFDRGDFDVAIAETNGTIARLRAVARDLDAATAGPVHRRR